MPKLCIDCCFCWGECSVFFVLFCFVLFFFCFFFCFFCFSVFCFFLIGQTLGLFEISHDKNRFFVGFPYFFCYLPIIRRRRSEYCWIIIPETKSRGLYNNVYWANDWCSTISQQLSNSVLNSATESIAHISLHCGGYSW